MRVFPIADAPAREEPRKLALLLVLCIVWLIPGLVGHDPWKPQEGVTFGVVYHMLQSGDWLVPTLAGEPYLNFGPLYYWTAAVFVKLFGWALAPYDAARLASGFYMTLTLAGIALAARELYGRTMPRLALALLIGSVGLLVHAHEMVTDTALLAGYALVLWAISMR